MKKSNREITGRSMAGIFDSASTILRTQLGAPRFETLWNEGTLLTLDATLDLALQETTIP